jgi:hypothetical protein
VARSSGQGTVRDGATARDHFEDAKLLS